MSAVIVTLRAKLSGAVYCNRSCLFVGRGGSMVSGFLGKISRLCPPMSDGPSDDGFQLTLSVSKFTYLINE